ncbi:MAG: methionine--tRNA ligase, partial [Longimicrobiales bacterium]
MSDKITYLTAAIDYANGPPHMGHAIEKIGVDVMARYCRLRGEDVYLLLGMDEHGLKVMQSAESVGISPQEFVDDIANTFQTTWTELGISNDDFIRTTQSRHRIAVEEMISRMQAAGDIYRGKYSGYYCVGCEAFKRDDELVRDGDIVRCPLHPSRDAQWTEEENWFFRLSRYQQQLLDLFDARPDFLQPDSRRNEVRNVIEAGLEDISVSRARLPWGIPWPGDTDHTVYVWIDALTNYLSAVGFPDDSYLRYWPADVHVIGKDITRFHCVYWPAMLMSAGVELPRTVWAHGFVAIDGMKISKSEGVTLELSDVVQRHGVDAFRYYMLRDVPWNGDGVFSLDRFDERYNAELANNLGNLANRAISMIERYREGVVPAGSSAEMDGVLAASIAKYRAAMDANLLHQGIGAAIELASLGNGYVETRAPWKAAKDPSQAGHLDETLNALARCVAMLAVMLEPFMPMKMSSLRAGLGVGASEGLG